MQPNDLDKIFYTQLVIARLGEKELMNWWNTDVAYKLGGAAFLRRLLGKTIAPLAAGELIDLINVPDNLKSLGTSFGRLFEKSPGQNITSDLTDIMLILASGIIAHEKAHEKSSEKGKYTLCYYKGEAHASA